MERALVFVLEHGSFDTDARAPFILPEQKYEFIGATRTRIYSATCFTINNRFMAMLSNREGNANEPVALLRQADHSRQMKQNLSVLFKAALKYIFSTCDRDRLGNDDYLHDLLTRIIVERTDPSPLPHYANDKIYKLAKISLDLETYYPSVFREGVFHVINAPKLRAFIFVEVCLVRNCSSTFFNDFIQSSLDISLIRQERNELLSPVYLEHEKSIVAIKRDLVPNPDIKFHLNITPEILSRERIILVSIENLGYHLLIQTEGAEIEIASFVSEMWKNDKRIANYNEARILRIDHQLFHLDKGGKIVPFNALSNNYITGIRILQFFPNRKNKFASLLPL